MPLPTLTTERLILRAYLRHDLDGLRAILDDAEVKAHVGGPRTESDLQRLFQSFLAMEPGAPLEVWGVWRQDSGEYVGHAWLKDFAAEGGRELGYLVSASHRSQGVATEMARAVRDYAFAQRHYPRLVSTVDTDNLASIRVLEKAGLRFERREEDEDGEYLVYSAGGERPVA